MKNLSFINGEKTKLHRNLPFQNKGKCYPWAFALIDSEERSPTYQMVEKTKKFFIGPEGEKRIQANNKRASDVMQAFSKNNFTLMAKTINEAANSLEELGIVTDKAKNICNQTKDLGVPAIKVTGSGGGGCLLALLEPFKQQEQFDKLLTCFGSKKVFRIFL